MERRKKNGTARALASSTWNAMLQEDGSIYSRFSIPRAPRLVLAECSPARRRAIHHDLGAIPLHPLLAAAYPVIFLFTVNAAEQVTLATLWLPLLVSVGAAAAILVVLGLLTGNWQRAGLVTTVLVIGFFGYGHAWNAFGGALDSQWPLIVAWTLLVAVALVLAVKARRQHALAATGLLNVVTAVLLALNAWSLGSTMVAVGASAPGEDVSPLDLAPADPDDLPDVYYIIVDRYAGPTALRETYGFDNEPFLTTSRSVVSMSPATPTPTTSRRRSRWSAPSTWSTSTPSRSRPRRRTEPTETDPSPAGRAACEYRHVQGAGLQLRPDRKLVDADAEERRRRSDVRVLRPGRVLRRPPPDHADARPVGAARRARGPMGLARDAGQQQLRARPPGAGPLTPRPEIRVRAPRHDPPAVRARHRWLAEHPG